MGAPLEGVRVLDLTDGLAESAGRYLADLGAEVIRIESPGGTRSRAAEPVVDGVSLPFALRNANKLGLTLDLDDPTDWARFDRLVASADILVWSGAPARLDALALDSGRLAELNPALVLVTVSAFGRTGPYRDRETTEEILAAMGGVLSRSGQPGDPPLLPPAGLVEETIGVHAAWSVLLAYQQRLRTGQGESVDLAGFEVVAHGFDPGFGTQGSAAAGRSEDYPRGRPDAADFYPVFDCADGQVRICLLAPRQWQGMFEWLGRPERFADPKYAAIGPRFKAADVLHPLIADLFAGRTREELAEEGAKRGVPVGAVLTLPEVLSAEHYDISGALMDADIAPGVRARIPSGHVSFNGRRAGFRHPAPTLGLDDAVAEKRCVDSVTPQAAPGTRPLEGIRVLDLGVIVFGAELSRQFADYGADVIKIETEAFPDGLRQSRRGAALAASVAWGHRNKRSLGLDLRTPEGKQIFRRLAARADVVLANFKPGTLASMGLSPEELTAVNPGLVVSESSAYGSGGPWQVQRGYGPLVRAATGLSDLWRSPARPDTPGDGATVFPDHVAAQVSAVAVLAALIARRRSGRGTAIEVAQADTALVALGPLLAAESLGAAEPGPAAGVFPCAGDDEWCVVAMRDDADWARVCTVAGRPEAATDPDLATGAARNRALAQGVFAAWAATRTPAEAAAELQAAGVPAGPMLRLPDLLTDPHLVARRAFTTLHHDLLPVHLATATRVGHFSRIPEPELRQAPLAGEQTREICRSLLGMGDAEIDRLVADGVLQVPPAAPVEAVVRPKQPAAR